MSELAHWELQQVRRVMQHCVANYKLKLEGTHGLPHWTRVLINGRRLCARVGVSHHVVDLYAILHDSQRINEGKDPQHGARAERTVAELAYGGCLNLATDDLAVLCLACRLHSTGVIDGPLLAQICWDADRLDLGRVGITPTANKLCTEAAREPEQYDWAVCRGRLKVAEELPWLVNSKICA